MIPSAETLLMLAVVGLYIYDSALLLYCNEGVLLPKGKDRWSLRLGSHSVGIFGKELYIPNPFLMHRPLFRLSWKFEGSAVSTPWSPPRNAYGTLVPMIWSIAVALFILLPLGFFTRLGDRILFPALLFIFANISIALLWIWFNRATLHLSRQRFAALAFESVICPPFSLNLIRHLSLGIPVDEDLVLAARRLQAPRDWDEARAALLARLDMALEGEDPESERFKLMRERRKMLGYDGVRLA